MLLLETMNFMCKYVLDQGYDLQCVLEAKLNEPCGDIYNATTGHMPAFIKALDHPEMVGVNPEVAHEHMAGLDFLHGVAQAWEAGKLFHRQSLGARGMKYEKLDQLVNELLLGVH